MKSIRTFALMLMFAVVATVNAQTVNFNSVLPQPQSIKNGVGSYLLTNSATIAYDNKLLKREAEFLAEYIGDVTGMKLNVKRGKGDIVLKTSLKSDNKEAYTLTVSTQGIEINGASAAGVFYGVQTLRKSLPVTECSQLTIPSVSIADQPRFGYRGVMLDCARHYYSVWFVKRYIDILALHNINNLHWHLTDDQGWRFEVKAYPELAKKGCMRKQTMVGKSFSTFDGHSYGGYYTQEECRDIIKYAAERHINIVPEIDLPGHMVAALHVFPELGCTGGPYEVSPKWGVMDDVLCAGNPKTVEFIKTVLTELCEVFPSKLIHVGGDECPKVRWKSCPKCQAKADELGFTTEREHKLQSYIISEAGKHLNSLGRDFIGWDEILEGGLADGAKVMSWRGLSGGIAAARMNHDVIMTPTDYCYIDYYQSKDQQSEPLAIGGYLPLEKVYSFNPIPEALSADEQKHILGAQVNLWTEYITEPWHMEYMLLPRLAALSEVDWCQDKNYEAFTKRLEALKKHYELYKYNYRK